MYVKFKPLYTLNVCLYHDLIMNDIKTRFDVFIIIGFWQNNLIVTVGRGVDTFS